MLVESEEEEGVFVLSVNPVLERFIWWLAIGNLEMLEFALAWADFLFGGGFDIAYALEFVPE